MQGLLGYGSWSAALLVACLGCGEPAAGVDDAGVTDATPEGGDAAPDADAADAKVDKAAGCLGTFGTDLASVGFARFDGTVVAVVPPAHPTCPYPNATHSVVQIRVGASVYRMVINVQSDRGGVDPRIRTAVRAAPLPAPAWKEGIHTDAPLDYVALGAHTADFAPRTLAEAAAEIDAAIPLGARVSVYATAGGKPESAHLVHRNATNEDGAIVVDPEGAPKFYLFAFDKQTF